MKTRAVIFDCDGTILDTEDLTIESICFAIEKVNGPLPSKAQIKNLFGPGIDKILKELIGDDKLASEAFKFFIDHQKQVIPQMKSYKGIRELLINLKKNNIPTGMVTGRHSSDLEIIFRAHQLDEYFNVVVSDDQLENPKPDPEGIILAASKLNIEPKFIYYVGDAKTDIEAARACGASSIAALWDHRVDHEVMTLEKPDFMAATPKSILEKFNL